MESVKAVLTQLPPVNRVVLAELIRLLAAIAQNAEIVFPRSHSIFLWFSSYKFHPLEQDAGDQSRDCLGSKYPQVG